MKKRIQFLGLAFCVLVSIFFGGCKKIITDIEQYRTIGNTKYYKAIEEYTNLVMPEKIEEYFIVDKYLLMFDPMDYTHEEYLEITIEDKEQYDAYIAGIVAGKEIKDFEYDSEYKEIVFNDWFLTTKGENGEQLFMAEVQKIIFSEKAQKIIFVSLAIPSNYGPIPPENFYYFTKYSIPMIEKPKA